MDPKRLHCVKSVQIRSFFWSVFSRFRTEYGEMRSPSISPYSVRMRENADQKKLRIWTLFTQRLPVVNVKFCLIIQIQIVVSLKKHRYLLSEGMT